MANANGGDLVYGIGEKSGRADCIVPIPVTDHPIDRVKRRLSQILESDLEPSAVGVAMRAVPLANGDYVLVVRVAASFQRPHRTRSDAHWRWVVRVDTHTVDLTYDQIRDAFDRNATLAERARRFRDERLSGVISGSIGRPLRAGPKCLVHLIPLASIAGRASVEIRLLYNANTYQAFILPGWSSCSRSMNLDGLAVYPDSKTNDLAYTQIFRTGALEAARFVGALHVENEEDRSAIPSGVVSGLIRDSLTQLLEAAARWNIDGPAIASVALLDVSGYSFAYQSRHYITQRNPSDRSNLILPEFWIEQLSRVRNADEIARPLLDTLWQSFDLECCMFYNDQGQWNMY